MPLTRAPTTRCPVALACRPFGDSAMQLFQGQSSEESESRTEELRPPTPVHSAAFEDGQHWMPLRHMSVPLQVDIPFSMAPVCQGKSCTLPQPLLICV